VSDMAKKHKQNILDIRELSIVYKRPGKQAVRAVNQVSLAIKRGQSLGIVGESGCGKSTLARTIMGLQLPHSGSLLFENKEIFRFNSREMAQYRRRVQMVFQDAAGSLNPRMTSRQTLTEVLKVHKVCKPGEFHRKIDALLELVALPHKLLDVYPREMSGGQCQRVSIARCLALAPDVIIADEPVSALDVSVQARILNLLRYLQSELNLALILISHDLAVVRHICDDVVVMHNGIFVESGHTRSVLENPQHPYTKSLLDAVPDVKRALKAKMM